jgi:DNA-binding response OmpR family regulator
MRKRSNVSKGADTEGRSVTLGKRKGRVIPFRKGKSPTNSGNDQSLKKRLTILVVEDHGSLCDMLSLYFMRYGYHVRTANDGEAALALLAAEQIHLVLLDLMLPGLDGFSVLREIRQHSLHKSPYVIVVSAGASVEDRATVLDLGANEYIGKPFHLIRLLERIQHVEQRLLD